MHQYNYFHYLHPLDLLPHPLHALHIQPILILDFPTHAYTMHHGPTWVKCQMGLDWNNIRFYKSPSFSSTMDTLKVDDYPS